MKNNSNCSEMCSIYGFRVCRNRSEEMSVYMKLFLHSFNHFKSNISQTQIPYRACKHMKRYRVYMFSGAQHAYESPSAAVCIWRASLKSKIWMNDIYTDWGLLTSGGNCTMLLIWIFKTIISVQYIQFPNCFFSSMPQKSIDNNVY